MEQRHPASGHHAAGMAEVVQRNIQALLVHRQQQEKRKGLQERLADKITNFTGSMKSVYIHLLVFGGWIAVNLGWIKAVPPFDPTFVMLAMVASVEAIFLSTFVLISQNRMQRLTDQRSDLDLQISLLSEHEVTRLITLVQAIAAKMQIEASHDPELKELSQDVHPENVLDHLEKTDQTRRNE